MKLEKISFMFSETEVQTDISFLCLDSSDLKCTPGVDEGSSEGDGGFKYRRGVGTLRPLRPRGDYLRSLCRRRCCARENSIFRREAPRTWVNLVAIAALGGTQPTWAPFW